MGMHFGILAADLPWAELQPLLWARTGRFLDQGPVESIDDLDLEPNDEGYPTVAGEHGGRSYVLDTSTRMSMLGVDFLVELSKAADTLVIGCGAETVSGTYFFLAVRSGEVLRQFYHCQALLAEPLDEGDLLPTEDEKPFEDFDGAGLIAGLAHFGFDFDGWYDSGRRQRYLYTADEVKASEERGVLLRGPLAERMDEHNVTHLLSEEERPSIQLITRDATTRQIVSMQDTGLRLGDERISDPGFWQKFWDRMVN
jgi:hypothetical protein